MGQCRWNTSIYHLHTVDECILGGVGVEGWGGVREWSPPPLNPLLLQPDNQHLKSGSQGDEAVSGHIIVVSHGGTINCLMRHFAEYGCEHMVTGLTPNTALNSFMVCVERSPHPRCVSVRTLVTHDITHLEPRGQC